MILVTGAGGKTGRAILAALRSNGEIVRGFFRRPITMAGVDCFVGDMTHAADWDSALHGCDKVYHICPNMHPDEVDIGRIAIRAAQQAKISHFVYHSVLHPQTQAMPHHWHKLLVEEMLLESGIPFTILQPTAYMQNIRLDALKASGVYAVPYSAETKIALIDLHDVATVATLVFTETSHLGATYQLVGQAALDQTAVAAHLSQRLGIEIKVTVIDRDAWRDSAEKNGLPSFAINTLLAMFRFYESHGLHGSPNTLRWLLQREPTQLAIFDPT